MDWKNPDYSEVYTRRLKRLEKIRADREYLAAHLRFYEDNPVTFIEDWGVTFDPRLAARKLNPVIPFILFPKQRELIEWLHERVRTQTGGVIEKSRDTGISWCCAAFGVWTWLFLPSSAIGFGSYRQDLVDMLGVPDALLEKCRIFIAHLPRELRPEGLRSDEHLNLMRIKHPSNGATIRGDVGDNIGRGKRATLYFVDEAAHLEHQELVDASLAATADVVIYASTPFGQGAFWRKCRSGAYPVFKFHWRNDPRKDEAWGRSTREKIGDVIFAQEYDLDHSGSIENVLIPAPWIESSRQLAKLMPDAGQGAKVVAGLDVGGGKAKSVFIARQGPRVFMPDAWKKGDTTFTARRAIELVKAHGARVLNFDTVGVGEGVASTLRDEAAIMVPATSDKARRTAPQREQSIENLVNQAAWSPEDRRAASAQTEDVRVPAKVQGVNVGVPASEYVVWETGETSRKRFANLKAEIWWTARTMIQRAHELYLFTQGDPEGKKHPVEDCLLLPDSDELATQLSAPCWELKVGGKIAVESKEHLAKRGVQSPDYAEALTLTLVPETPGMRVETIAGAY